MLLLKTMAAECTNFVDDDGLCSTCYTDVLVFVFVDCFIECIQSVLHVQFC